MPGPAPRAGGAIPLRRGGQGSSTLGCMRLFTRYIARQVLLTTIVVALVLTTAVWLTQSLRFVDWIVNRGMPLSMFGTISLLLMPSLLSIILPIALFVGVLFTYARLKVESELVVMRATGVGPARMLWPAAMLGLLITAIGYFLSLYALPVSFRAFKDLQAEIRSTYTSVLIQEGVFTDVGNNTTLFVRAQGSEGDLTGLMVHDGRDSANPMTIVAERGQIVATPAGPRIVMVNGTRQQLSEKDGTISYLKFERYSVDIGRRADDGAAQSRQREAGERFLDELLHPDDISDDRVRRAMRAEAHARLTQPWFATGFVLIAVTALIAGEFSRRSQILRIVIAVLAVVAVQSMAIALGNLVTRRPPLFPLIYVNALLPMIVAPLVLSLLTGARQARGRPIPPARPTA